MISKKSGFSRFGQFAAAMSFLGLVALACLLPLRARAYLDPGTGSYVVQILIGVALGAGYTLKVYGAGIYQRITGKQGKVKSEKGKKAIQGKVKRVKGKVKGGAGKGEKYGAQKSK